MKKLFGIIAIVLLFSFVGIQSVDAQTYSVEYGWNSVACECSEPIDDEVQITVRTYPGDEHVETVAWEDASGNPNTIYGYENINGDCKTDCYKVIAEVRFIDSGGQCCYGTSFELFSGEELVNGATFILMIPMY